METLAVVIVVIVAAVLLLRRYFQRARHILPPTAREFHMIFGFELKWLYDSPKYELGAIVTMNELGREVANAAIAQERAQGHLSKQQMLPLDAAVQQAKNRWSRARTVLEAFHPELAKSVPHWSQWETYQRSRQSALR